MGYLIAYGRSGGVYKSENQGLSWQSINQGLNSINPLDIIALSDTELYVATQDNGVYKSVDGGNTWFLTALTSINVRYLVASKDDVIFAGTRDRGIFRTYDGGNTWEPANVGLPENKQITSLLVSDFNPQILYTTLDTNGGNRLFVSYDEGENWSQLAVVGAGAAVNGIAEQGNDTNLYVATVAGLYLFDLIANKSSRLSINYFQVQATDIALNANASTLFVAVHGGVFHSQDEGQNWIFGDGGLTHPNIRTLFPDPSEEALLYLGTYSDQTIDVMFKSNSYGLSWKVVGADGYSVPDDDVRTIVVDPNDTSIMYVGTFGGGVFKSIDRGNVWFPINAGITRNEIIKLVIDPHNSQVLYAVAAGGPLFKTKDGGIVWQPVENTFNKDIRDVDISSDGGTVCYIIYGEENQNLSCSNDFGETWHVFDAEINSAFVSQIEISSVSPEHLYVGTDDKGVLWSRDGGWTWQPINDNLPTGSVNALIAHPVQDDRLFAIVESHGVFEFNAQYFKLK